MQMTFKMLANSTPLDGGGVCGEVMHYSMVIAFVGSALLVFVYLWRKGRLDMDEEPKYQMMKDEESISEKEKGDV
ncbi:MAG: hypothetical protein ACI8RA_000148 [Chlamydiales bacterium]